MIVPRIDTSTVSLLNPSDRSAPNLPLNLPLPLVDVIKVLWAIVMDNLVKQVCASVSPTQYAHVRSAADLVTSSLGDPTTTRSWSQLERSFEVNSSLIVFCVIPDHHGYLVLCLRCSS